MMISDEHILDEVTRLMDRGEVAIFLGSDLPKSVSGAPSWTELAKALAKRDGFPDVRNWPEAAARYEQFSARRNLVEWLDKQLSELRAGPIYPLLAELPVLHYISTTYDNLLQTALASAGPRPVEVVNEDDLNFVETERPVVVKLLGEASAGNRGSLLMTSRDIGSLHRSRAQILAQVVYPFFSGKTVLILGQDPRQDLFRDIYYHNPPQSNALRRQAYAVWQGMEEWEKQSWADDKLTVIDTDPVTLCRHLLTRLGKAEPSLENEGADPGDGEKTAEEVETISNQPREVRRILTSYFSTSELQTLAFDLGVDHEILPGSGKMDLARELVSHMEHRGRLEELIEQARRINSSAPF